VALSSNSTALNFSPSSIARLVPPPVLTCETASAKPSCSIAAALSPPPMMLVASLSAIKFYNVPPTYFAQTNRGHATIRVDKPLDRYYPQSNGKLERYHRSLKHECIRQKTPGFSYHCHRPFSLKIRQATKSRIPMFLQGGMARDPFGGESRDLEPFTPN
jgi:hypothetical protein